MAPSSAPPAASSDIWERKDASIRAPEPVYHLLREKRQTLLLLLSHNKEICCICCLMSLFKVTALVKLRLLQPGAGIQPARTSVFCQRVCLQTDGGEVRGQGGGSLPAARAMCLRFLLFSQLPSCSLTAWKTAGGASRRSLAGARVRAHTRQGGCGGSRVCPPGSGRLLDPAQGPVSGTFTFLAKWNCSVYLAALFIPCFYFSFLESHRFIFDFGSRS